MRRGDARALGVRLFTCYGGRLLPARQGLLGADDLRGGVAHPRVGKEAAEELASPPGGREHGRDGAAARGAGLGAGAHREGGRAPGAADGGRLEPRLPKAGRAAVTEGVFFPRGAAPASPCPGFGCLPGDKVLPGRASVLVADKYVKRQEPKLASLACWRRVIPKFPAESPAP
jgi:hypothetical protein